MIELHIIFLATFVVSCYKLIGNDIDNLGIVKVKILFKNKIGLTLINILLIYPISIYYLVRYGETNYYLVLPEILLNYYIYDFVYYHIHRYIQDFEIHRLRHSTHLASFTTYYCNCLDFFLLNVFPIYIGLFLIKAQRITYIYMTVIETYILVLTNTKRGSKCRFYLYHCFTGDCNYGINLIFDKYYNTLFPN